MKSLITLERWILKPIDDLELWPEIFRQVDELIESLPKIHRRSDVMRVWKFPHQNQFFMGLEISGSRPYLEGDWVILDLNEVAVQIGHKQVAEPSISWEKLIHQATAVMQNQPELKVWAVDFRVRLEEDHEVRLEYSLVFLPELDQV